MVNKLLQKIFVGYVCLLSRQALAQILSAPELCAIASPPHAAYTMGFRSGEYLAKQYWEHVDNECLSCNKFNGETHEWEYVDNRCAEFNTALFGRQKTLAPPYGASLYSRCRYAGIVDGIAAYAIAPGDGACENSAVLGGLYGIALCDTPPQSEAWFSPPAISCNRDCAESCLIVFEAAVKDECTQPVSDEARMLVCGVTDTSESSDEEQDPSNEEKFSGVSDYFENLRKQIEKLVTNSWRWKVRSVAKTVAKLM
jgi:hypothetical protein